MAIYQIISNLSILSDVIIGHWNTLKKDATDDEELRLEKLHEKSENSLKICFNTHTLKQKS